MFSFVEISTSNAFFGVNVREVANSENNHPLNVSRPRCVLSPLCVRLPYLVDYLTNIDVKYHNTTKRNESLKIVYT